MNNSETVLPITKEEFFELYRSMKLASGSEYIKRTLYNEHPYVSLWRKIEELHFLFLTEKTYD